MVSCLELEVLGFICGASLSCFLKSKCLDSYCLTLEVSLFINHLHHQVMPHVYYCTKSINLVIEGYTYRGALEAQGTQANVLYPGCDPDFLSQSQIQIQWGLCGLWGGLVVGGL